MFNKNSKLLLLPTGSTAGGHYVALCKHPLSKKWHEFNDNVYVFSNI